MTIAFVMACYGAGCPAVLTRRGDNLYASTKFCAHLPEYRSAKATDAHNPASFGLEQVSWKMRNHRYARRKRLQACRKPCHCPVVGELSRKSMITSQMLSFEQRTTLTSDYGAF